MTDDGSPLRKRPGRWTAVPNGVLEDARLSYKARGILGSLLAKPDGWKVRAEAIERGGQEGREAIRSGVKELIALGYYRRVRYSVRSEAGVRWFTEVQISPEPIADWVAEAARLGGATPTENRIERRSGYGLPSVDKPSVGSSAVEEPAAVLDLQTEHSDNSPPPSEVAPSKPKAQRRTRVPDGFALDDDLLTWTATNTPGLDLIFEVTQFVEYHTARGSTMADWRAAWRTWARNAARPRSPARTQRHLGDVSAPEHDSARAAFAGMA